jgi:flagellar protein FliJ
VRRFRFKLEKLLELRGFHERKAELVLAEKAGRCALLDNRLRETAEARFRTGREMFAAGRLLADYRAAELYIVRLDRDRDRLTEELASAELEREDARLDYVEKRKSRELLDKIKERRQGEYYRLALREETKALDDLARPKASDGAARPNAAGEPAGRRLAGAKG